MSNISTALSLAAVTATETPEQELARLRAENAKLKANKANQGTSMKVSEKGGISLYGLGRFPVTLYRSQWATVIGMVKDGTLEAFIEANKHVLKEKPAKE